MHDMTLFTVVLIYVLSLFEDSSSFINKNKKSVSHEDILTEY